MLLASCASLNTGWARVTWVEGRVSPVVACTARIDAEGDVAMECVPMGKAQAELLWRGEQRRTQGGEL
jgi:hypothetical protein